MGKNFFKKATMKVLDKFRLGRLLKLPLYLVGTSAIAGRTLPKLIRVGLYRGSLARIGLAQQSKAVFKAAICCRCGGIRANGTRLKDVADLKHETLLNHKIKYNGTN